MKRLRQMGGVMSATADAIRLTHFRIFHFVAVILIMLFWSVPAFNDSGFPGVSSMTAFEQPINIAVKAGDLAKVKALIEDYPGTVSSQDEFSRWMPLHVAALFNKKDIAELLLAKGAPVNSGDRDYLTPLYIAVREGHKDIVELLLAHGADVEFKASGDRMILHEAANKGYKDIVELLLANKAKINARQGDGATPLHMAAEGGHKNVVEYLLNKGAEIDAKNNGGATPLTMALSTRRRSLNEDTDKGREEVALFLIAKGADVNVRTGTVSTLVPGNTLLLSASWNLNITKSLLAKGVDVNIKGGIWSSTPLHAACSRGRKDIIELLLANKADVNATDIRKDTPLHMAAQAGHQDIVELLLANKADVNAKNNNGSTPLDEAAKKGHKDVVELLRRNGGRE
jgi:ankyrin repeat protein